jgi:hypothetical protein
MTYANVVSGNLLGYVIPSARVFRHGRQDQNVRFPEKQENNKETERKTAE